jgi:hypothetical protein
MSAWPWVVPTLRRTDWGAVIVTDPSELAGMQAMRVEGQPCRRQRPDHLHICGLAQGHDGPCWACTPELVDGLHGAIGLSVLKRATL